MRRPLIGLLTDDDLLLTLFMQKMTGPLQQPLRSHKRSVITFQQALDTMYADTKSKRFIVPIIAHAPSQGRLQWT